MDIVDLLVLLAFVAFPLLQLLMEKLGAGRKGAPPHEEERQEPAAPSSVTTSEPVALPKSDTGWSSGWGGWPAETLEDLSAEEVVSEAEADELISLQDGMESWTVPEAIRVTVPVVSLETLKVDREAEHVRMQSLVTKRAVVAPRRAPPVIGRSLQSRADLRRAIILAEVLGRPRGLQ